ncbi:MAG TPA: hypothetical protein VJV23_09355 [Candidatus Polarisedimenticolia bacterium]|nr:hypothetical protein [Candidatus Polarisedimenticolia bacterium]
MNRWLRAAGCCAALTSLSGAATALAESAVMSVDKATALGFLRAASPYTFEAATAGLRERFTFSNPRELRFEQGAIRLKVDCRGETLGVSAVLEPTLTIQFDHRQNAFVARVQSLPATLGGLGTIHLDRFIQPVIIPSSFSNTFDEGIPGLTMSTVIRDLKVLEDRIEAKVDLVFRKAAPARPAAVSR